MNKTLDLKAYLKTKDCIVKEDLEKEVVPEGKIEKETKKKRMKIAHLADIQVRFGSRHAEYKSVFERLYSDLKKIILINEEIFRKIERYIFIQ